MKERCWKLLPPNNSGHLFVLLFFLDKEGLNNGEHERLFVCFLLKSPRFRFVNYPNKHGSAQTPGGTQLSSLEEGLITLFLSGYHSAWPP